MIGTKHDNDERSLSESSSSGTGETSRRSDRRGVLVVEAFHSKVGIGLGLERKVVALYALATSSAGRIKTNIDPSSLLDVYLDMSLSGPTGSTADFAHSVNLTSSSLISVLNHYFWV
jgi:hypothetical protein